jgi:hypothetical protein
MHKNYISSVEEMILLFIRTCPLLVDKKLTKTQQAILYKILTEFVVEKNVCTIDPIIKNTIADSLNIQKITVDHYIRAFVKNGIFVKFNNVYFLNSLIFGKKDWIDLARIVYLEETAFDFEHLRIIKTNSTADGK